MQGKNNNILKNLKAVYFIGIGGIGMSALARYFNNIGVLTFGYDKTPSKITDNLKNEGIDIHFEENINLIDARTKGFSKENVIVVFTPAVPENHSELQWFKNNDYKIFKRAEILGLITNVFKTVAIAGTHGKTSVSTIIAHIFKSAKVNFNGFLGGISKNYNSNLILSNKPDEAKYAVTEADEFDRSFLHLYPWSAVITSVDEDHLDIYEDINDLKQTFGRFAGQIHKDGFLIIKKGVELNKANFPKNTFSYSLNDAADFYAVDIKNDAKKSAFNIVTPKGIIEDVIINIPGNLNVENVVAATAIAQVHGISAENIKLALKTWTGVKRRFEYIINTPEIIYIDDYAHHPEELKAFIGSIKNIYKDKHITGIFQPHLFTRTQDFAEDFAKSLDLLDELFLLDIYPAREEPIAGVTSNLILDKVSIKNKRILSKEDVVNKLKEQKIELLLTIGAGDINNLVEPIKQILENK